MDHSVSRAFHRSFEVLHADTPELRSVAYAIRYAVYCKEFGWEDKARFPDAEERDPYDSHSLHCLLLHKPSNRHTATLRLVLANPDNPQAPFPFEATCKHNLSGGIARLLRRDRRLFGEISRMAVLSDFRQHNGRRHKPDVPPSEARQAVEEERLTAAHMSMVLSLAGASLMVLAGLRGVFAMMEPWLAQRLATFDLHFQQVGEPVNHRGIRAPFYISCEDVFNHLSADGLAILEIIRDQLARSSEPRLVAMAV